MKNFLIFLLFMMTLQFSGFAHAGETPWAVADQVRARLLSGKEGETAVEVEIAEGWHAYWRVPGDSGLPPQFDWQASENISNISVEWPFPVRFDEMGLTTFGYKGRVVFPVRYEAPKDAARTKIALKLNIMVCNEICIPQELNLALERKKNTDTAQAALIESARRFIPKEDSLIKIETIVAGPEALVINTQGPKSLENAAVFAIIDDMALTAIPEITPDKADNHRAMIKITKPADVENFTEFLAGKEVEVIVVNGSDAALKKIKF